MSKITWLTCGRCGMPARSDPCRLCGIRTGLRTGWRRVQQANALVPTIDPQQPCCHLPGSVERLAMLIARKQVGLPLHHPADRVCLPEELGQVLSQDWTGEQERKSA